MDACGGAAQGWQFFFKSWSDFEASSSRCGFQRWPMPTPKLREAAAAADWRISPRTTSHLDALHPSFDPYLFTFHLEHHLAFAVVHVAANKGRLPPRSLTRCQPSLLPVIRLTLPHCSRISVERRSGLNSASTFSDAARRKLTSSLDLGRTRTPLALFRVQKFDVHRSPSRTPL